ncbi:MAG: DUF1207 domain-containing protein, partial [Pseudomonadota bacterium]
LSASAGEPERAAKDAWPSFRGTPSLSAVTLARVPDQPVLRWQFKLNLFQFAHSFLTVVLPTVIIAGDVLSGKLEVGRAIQAGLELRNASTRRTRLMLETYSGHSPNGQFYRDRLRYTGIGIYFGF